MLDGGFWRENVLWWENWLAEVEAMIAQCSNRVGEYWDQHIQDLQRMLAGGQDSLRIARELVNV